MNQALVQQLFDYKDGCLYWKESPSKSVRAGSLAGTSNHRGYWKTRIHGKYYGNHRLIFMHFNGYVPNYVDHIDGNTSNNRIENLRDSTPTQNQLNSRLHKNNTSGAKGVVWSRRMNKWFVQLKVNGTQKYFGSYKDIDYAKFIADAMRYKYHKEFARHE